jgi:hypothetical protein
VPIFLPQWASGGHAQGTFFTTGYALDFFPRVATASYICCYRLRLSGYRLTIVVVVYIEFVMLFKCI